MRNIDIFKQLLNCCTLFFLLAITATRSSAQTPITISSPDGHTVCVGTVGSYGITPTPNLNYTWVTSTNGAISGSNTGPSVSAQWLSPGTGFVEVSGKDANGNLLEHGTYPITVMPVPNPNLEWDTRVGCQIITEKPEEREPGENIDDGPCVRVCEHSTVKYWITAPTGGPVSWTVSGAVSVTPSGSSCIVVWGSAGFGSISVTEGYAAPLATCEGTTTMCIEIIHSPIALFTAIGADPTPDEPILACQNNPIYFQDLSDAGSGSPIVSWYWDFDDGTFSTATDPAHAYANPGSYTVTLTVTNECNCTSKFSKKIEVSPYDEPLTIECPSVVCQGATATYQLTGPHTDEARDCLASGAAEWQVIGGTIVSPIPATQTYIEVLWDNVGPDGFGYVIFNPGPDCGLCPSPTVAKVPVILTTGTIEGPAFVCPDKKQYKYTLPQWPATLFEWTINTSTGATLLPNDQPNEIILLTGNPGPVTITGKYHNTLIGCSGTATIQVQVTNRIAVSGPLEACEGQTATYSLPGTLVGDWKISGPAGYLYTANNVHAISPTFAGQGNYVLNVQGSFCFDEPLQIKVQSTPPPPDFIDGEDTVCTNTPYVFTAGNALPGTIFEWSATGGMLLGQSGNQSTVVFSGAGPFAVHLVRRHIQSPNCPSAAITKTLQKLTVNVDITGTATVCPNTTHNYAATFTGGETYDWSISNTALGSVISGNGTPNIAILWNNGSASVSTTIKLVMRKCGEEYVRLFTVNINPLPVLTLTPSPSPLCDGQTLTITVGSYTGAVAWTDDHGNSYPTANVFSNTINANAQGNTAYTFTATVNNPYGCPGSISASMPVMILPKPAVSLSPYGTIKVCPPDPISIPVTATLQSGYQPTAQLEWFQNGPPPFNTCNPATPGCPTYTITGYGTYFVEAVGTNGCRDRSETMKVVSDCSTDTCILVPNPVLTVSHTTDHCGSYTFTGSHSGSPIDTGWDYDALHFTQTGGSGNTISLKADMAGAYTVSYWAEYLDANGDLCRKAAADNFVVPLIPGIRYGVLCNGSGTGYDLSIHDYSNLYPGTVITGYTYYINGNPVTGTVSSSTYTTALPGNANYNLQLKVTYTYAGSTYSCMSDILTAALPQLPVALFNILAPSQVCEGYPVEFQNQSQPSGLSNFWDFNDGSTSTVPNPHRTYPNSSVGTRNVILTVTDEYGCSNSVSHSKTIMENRLDGTLATIPSSGIVCPNTTITLDFMPNGPQIINNYNWMEGLNSYATTNYEPINVNQSGNYWVRINGDYLCYRDIPSVNAKIISVPEVQIVGDQYYCKDENIKLYGYAGSNVTYQWYLNGSPLGGYTSAFLDYPSTALAAGNYNFSLAIIYYDPNTGMGCPEMSNPFTVTISNPPVPPSVDISMLDCDQYLIELNASHPDPGNFTWSNGGFGSTIHVTEGGPYKVWFDNGKGCLSSTTVEVQRNPEDYLWVFPTGCYVFCKQDLPKTLYGPIVKFGYWGWLKNGSPDLYGSGFVDPYDINGSGVYNLRLKNDYCEKTSGDMDVSAVDCGNCGLKFSTVIRCTNVEGQGCVFVAFLTAYNPTPYNINVNLSTTVGYFAPSSVTLVPGNNTINLQFLPGPGYVTGSYLVTYSGSYYDVDLGEMVYCTSTIKSAFPPNCCEGASRPASMQSGVAQAGTLLTLSPNPAQGSVKVHYAFDKAASNMQVELYGMYGNKLRTEATSAHDGTLEWDMSKQAAGVYMVVLRQDGKIIRQAKLSLTK